MAAYEAILFDFDGVLADSEPVHFACWSEILQPHGVSVDWEDYRKACVGLAEIPTAEWLCRQADPPLDFNRLWAEYPRKQELFRRRMIADPPVSRNISEFLKSLNGYKLAVVSSSRRAEIEPGLEAGGIRRLFQAVVCGDDVESHKPAPDPYLFAARLLGVRAALVVEDSDAGVASGRAAGFDVLRVGSAAETPAAVLAQLNKGGT
jgi:HAD superfamily hydrolase (TIGR01509 family)